MKKRLAILGASYLQKPLVEKARELGIYSICFAWENGAVCKEICDKFYPISVTDKEKILEICREEYIDGVTSIATDIAVPTMAYVATELNLIGNSVNSGLISTNKYLMRDAFKNNLLPIPKYFLTKSTQEDINADNLKFPLIVKPVDRSGSLGISLVNDKHSLSAAINIAIEKSFSGTAIVEEFVIGKEISVETISWKGKHHILAYTDKITSGHPHFVELEHHQPSTLVNSDNKDLIDLLVSNALDALEIKYGASHVELIIADSGNVIITEIGARMGGDFIGSHLVELSTGYDFLEGVLNLSLGKFNDPVNVVKKFSGIYFITNNNQKSLAPILKEHKSVIRSEIINPDSKILTQSADRKEYFIYNADHKIELP